MHSRLTRACRARRDSRAGIFLRSGRRTTNSVPWPRPALAACTQPPCSSIMLRTRASPIPSPSAKRLVEPFTWVNRSKILGSMAGSIPMPVSRTRRTAWSPIASTVSSMRPPSSEYLALLFSRFDTTWASRPGSPSTSTACRGSETFRTCFRASIRGRLTSMASATTRFRSIGFIWRLILPWPTRDTSSKSSTSRVSCWT